MKINANQTFKSGRFSGELKHVNRVMPNDSNAKSIDRQLSKYNIGKMLLDAHQLVRKHYLPYVIEHDIRCEKKHRYSREYGSLANYWKHKKKYNPTDIGISTLGAMKDKDILIARMGRDNYFKGVSHGLANYIDGWNVRNPYIPVYAFKTNVDEKGAGHVHFGVVCMGFSKTGKPSASLTPAVIAEHGRPLDDYQKSHPEWFKWSKSYKMVRGSDGKKHRKFKGYKQRNLWKARRQQRKDAFSRFDNVEAHQLLRCVGKALHRRFEYHPTHQRGSVNMHDYKYTKSIEDKKIVKPAERQSSEADQLKLRAMSKSASVDRSASTMSGSLSEQVAKVKANLNSTSDYFSHASSVANNAVELVPRFKHHYSISAQNSASKVKSMEQAKLSASVSNHIQSVDSSLAIASYHAMLGINLVRFTTSSKARSLVASASSLSPSLSSSAFEYGSRMSSIASSSASVVVTHEYSSTNSVTNSYYDSYAEAKSNAMQSYSTSAQNSASKLISVKRGQLSQSASIVASKADDTVASADSKDWSADSLATSVSNDREALIANGASVFSTVDSLAGISHADYKTSFDSGVRFDDGHYVKGASLISLDGGKLTKSLASEHSQASQEMDSARSLSVSASNAISSNSAQLASSAVKVASSATYSASSYVKSARSSLSDFHRNIRKPVEHIVNEYAHRGDIPTFITDSKGTWYPWAQSSNDHDLFRAFGKIAQRFKRINNRMKRYRHNLVNAFKTIYNATNRKVHGWFNHYYRNGTTPEAILFYNIQLNAKQSGGDKYNARLARMTVETKQEQEQRQIQQRKAEEQARKQAQSKRVDTNVNVNDKDDEMDHGSSNVPLNPKLVKKRKQKDDGLSR